MSRIYMNSQSMDWHRLTTVRLMAMPIRSMTPTNYLFEHYAWLENNRRINPFWTDTDWFDTALSYKALLQNYDVETIIHHLQQDHEQGIIFYLIEQAPDGAKSYITFFDQDAYARREKMIGPLPWVNGEVVMPLSTLSKVGEELTSYPELNQRAQKLVAFLDKFQRPQRIIQRDRHVSINFDPF